MPVGHRLDFKQALSTLQQLKHQEDTVHQQRWKSYSSSWWIWQESWWHSCYEHHHEDEPSPDWSGKSVVKWLGYLFEVWFSEFTWCIITDENSVTVNRCKHCTSNTAKSYVKWLRWKQWLRWKAMSTSVRRTTASSKTTTGTTRTTCSSPSTTPMTTLAHCLHFNRRVAYMHWDCTRIFVPHLMMAPHTSWLKFWAHSQSSSFHSCLSPSSSSTSSCSLSSSTRRSRQTCAASLQKRLRTPWTPSLLTHFQ